MLYLGHKPGAAEWKAQINPLSYGGTTYQPIVGPSCTTSMPRRCLVKNWCNNSMEQWQQLKEDICEHFLLCYVMFEIAFEQ